MSNMDWREIYALKPRGTIKVARENNELLRWVNFPRVIAVRLMDANASKKWVEITAEIKRKAWDAIWV